MLKRKLLNNKVAEMLQLDENSYTVKFLASKGFADSQQKKVIVPIRMQVTEFDTEITLGYKITCVLDKKKLTAERYAVLAAAENLLMQYRRDQ